MSAAWIISLLIALIVGFAIGVMADYFWVRHSDEDMSHKRMDFHHMWERIHR